MKHVLIVLSEILLAAGVESLLMREKDLSVISSGLGNETTLRESLERFQPEVLILDESQDIAVLSRLINLIKDYPKLRIVVIDEDGNRARIYDKHEVRIKKASDLISAVKQTNPHSFLYRQSSNNNHRPGKEEPE